MNESKLIWLGIGVFIGFMLWGDRLHRSLPFVSVDESQPSGVTQRQDNSCSTCGGIKL